jgi:hypothetical protein
MTWNLMYLARLISRGGGISAHDNQRPAWDNGERVRLVDTREPALTSSDRSTRSRRSGTDG